MILTWPIVAVLAATAAAEEPDLAELAELVVVADRSGRTWIDTAGSVVRTDADALLRIGAQDLGDFARYDPTVSLPFDFGSGDGAYAYGQNGYGSINIRGIEGNRIAIELDGIRQPPQYVSTSFDLGAGDGAGGIGRDYFDPAMFEAIEVLKGGASALYGSDALGGVVSFRTPDPEHFLRGQDFGGFLRGQYFSANGSLAAQIGGATRDGDSAVMLLWTGRGGHETENHGGEPPNPADFESTSFLLKADHLHGPHTFRLALEAFERDLFTDVRSAVNSPFPLFTDFVHNDQFLERQRASLRWHYDTGGSVIDDLETHLYWQHAGSRSDSESASKPIVIGGIPIRGTERRREQSIHFDTGIAGLSAIARRAAGRHRILAGIDLSAETSENRYTRIDSGTAGNTNRTSFAPTGTLRAGWFAQDEIALSPRWQVTPGLRLDWQTVEPDPNAAYLERLASLGRFGQAPPGDFGNFSVSPRLSVSWKPRDTLHVYASYARGIRNPSAEELSMIFDHPPAGASPVGSLTVPNPDLEEEKSDAFEIGLKSEGNAGRFHAAAFHTGYTDFIENGVPTGRLDDDGREILTTANRGKAEIYGIEASGHLALGHWWAAAEGFTIGLSAAKVVGNNKTDGQPLNSVEPFQAIGFLGYDDPDGGFGGRLTGTWTDAVSRVDDTTSQGAFLRPPSWFALDLGLYWKPSDTLTIHAGVKNLLDDKYWAWSSVRRGGGHLGGNAVTDRTTAPGRNFSISLTKTF